MKALLGSSSELRTDGGGVMDMTELQGILASLLESNPGANGVET
jgi:hypothetical protein